MPFDGTQAPGCQLARCSFARDARALHGTCVYETELLFRRQAGATADWCSLRNRTARRRCAIGSRSARRATGDVSAPTSSSDAPGGARLTAATWLEKGHSCRLFPLRAEGEGFEPSSDRNGPKRFSRPAHGLVDHRRWRKRLRLSFHSKARARRRIRNPGFVYSAADPTTHGHPASMRRVA
jgi:hypothetical protein